MQYPHGQPRYAHNNSWHILQTKHKFSLACYRICTSPALFIPLSVQSPYMPTMNFSPSAPFISPLLPAPAAGLVSSRPVPSIIPRQQCIKDSSLQLNLKGETMTPGKAAELWRPPIKLFAFDLILSFLPPRWTWTGEPVDKRRHTQTKCSHTLISIL